MNESSIKLALIQHLLKTITVSEAIASEVMFANYTNRADLVLSSPTRLCAFEIKSPRDDFRRFVKQQTAYRESFLEVYLVTDRKHLVLARTQLNPSVGIMIVDQSALPIVIRKPRPRTRLTPAQAMSWLTSVELKKFARRLRDGSASDKDISSYCLSCLHGRFAERFAAFLNERGERLNSDDLSMLSSPDFVTRRPTE